MLPVNANREAKARSPCHTYWLNLLTPESWVYVWKHIPSSSPVALTIIRQPLWPHVCLCSFYAVAAEQEGMRDGPYLLRESERPYVALVVDGDRLSLEVQDAMVQARPLGARD